MTQSGRRLNQTVHTCPCNTGMPLPLTPRRLDLAVGTAPQPDGSAPPRVSLAVSLTRANHLRAGYNMLLAAMVVALLLGFVALLNWSIWRVRLLVVGPPWPTMRDDCHMRVPPCFSKEPELLRARATHACACVRACKCRAQRGLACPGAALVLRASIP